MIHGFSSFSTSYPRPILSIVPGTKFWTTTSDLFTSSLKMAMPFGFFRSTAIPFLLRFRA